MIFERYRTGGGVQGNLARGAINVLKTSVPYVDRVENRLEALGGVDEQSLEAAKMHTQWLLRNRHLAVTEDDYIVRVKEQFGDRIARVHCLRNAPTSATGNNKETIRLLLIPHLPALTGAAANERIEQNAILVPPALHQTITEYLNENHRMLTVQVQSSNPDYRRIRVRVTIKAVPGVNKDAIHRAALRRLHDYLHPLTGGRDGQGWPFKQPVRAADLQELLLQIPGIERLTGNGIELFLVDDSRNERKLEPAELTLLETDMVLSGDHYVEVQ